MLVAEKRSIQSRLGLAEADFYTLGYERLGLEEMFDILRDAGVRCLVDVREAPWSRVPEYRKDVLESRLDELGTARQYHIKYISMPALGNPAENRNSDRAMADMMEFYRNHVITKPDELDELANMIRKCKSALMCYEADPKECHRSVLAALIADRYGLGYSDLR